ncbi:PPC domain-containing protein [Paludicola sp. MB14-C6]|uniref:PPC domain-containing protein n=1 Tax=Paludihabitans sp. MB14-C6 TaxID=3070656 RepID=UPI0027DBD4AE|nr:PPC domain-containing protein [Paludicola sp. MB14-C6]WMJ24092.1 PPC domain-containing protein [Paludicola sp. MB14-C6]
MKKVNKRISALVSLMLVVTMACTLSSNAFALNVPSSGRVIPDPDRAEFSKDRIEKVDSGLSITPFSYNNVSMPGEAESNNTMGSADSISLTSGRTAAINTSSDIDWFVFSPTSSGRYRIDASDIPTGTDYDMQLYDASNNSMGSSTSGNPYETIIVNLAASANYYLRVYSYNSATYSNSNYCVTVTNDSCALLNWNYPFAGTNLPKYVSSKYGYRTGQYAGNHYGVDLGDCSGLPLYSATEGTWLSKARIYQLLWVTMLESKHRPIQHQIQIRLLHICT